jgi:hypothetical protein
MRSSTRIPAVLACATLAAAACEGRATALKVTHDAAADGTMPVTDGPRVVSYMVELNPLRQLDLVFMIDNSPSMAPKQAKLRANFPRLIAALKNPIDDGLPDLRVAIIDSDLGTGGAYANGSCGPKLDGDASVYGDLGRFQMIGASGCGVTSTGALWLEYADGHPVNFTGDIGTVFGCLAGNLGTLGCGEEHQLQAFELALVTQGVGNETQQAMLRPNANLALVFLSDEDDCSAAMNYGMFGDLSDLRGESASLRCVTRSTACGGRNLTVSPPGYPTSAAFAAPLSTCQARTDACSSTLDGGKPTDTSKPTTCSPLRSVQRMAAEIKALKAKADEQIFVVGIFGWPLDDTQMADATFKIALAPNPNTYDTQHPQVWETWPVCYDPDHQPDQPDPATGFDVEAAGWGGTAGLRLSAFVDEFGANGLKFSICQPDFSDSMRLIGGGLARMMQNLCVPEAITSFTSCSANYVLPGGGGNDVVDPTVILACDEQPTTYPCYRLVSDPTLCPGTDYLVELDRGSASSESIKPGTKLRLRCQ